MNAKRGATGQDDRPTTQSCPRYRLSFLSSQVPSKYSSTSSLWLLWFVLRFVCPSDRRSLCSHFKHEAHFGVNIKVNLFAAIKAPPLALDCPSTGCPMKRVSRRLFEAPNYSPIRCAKSSPAALRMCLPSTGTISGFDLFRSRMPSTSASVHDWTNARSTA